ncbi:MAG: type I-C CRISPR-associated endonuclease Cas1c [Veillonellaceae bacterium]|nr:type I-C CRISPR-associated endonuclease Cas1c [Veillonellaceae bacterium]MDD6923127.1 type I-C CRISPR-associated endonuclease Cas1c [Veillonellaceae bacterium]
MKRFLNTLFVTSDDIYLSLHDENVEALKDKKSLQKVPLQNLENIISFSYKGASPALLGECAKRHIGFSFMTPNGKFLARIAGQDNGNIILRKSQYRISDNKEASLKIARLIITAKIYNARSVIMRALRDHALSVDEKKFGEVVKSMLSSARAAIDSGDGNTLRGIEGDAARAYFSVMDDMILQNKKKFYFHGRSRRPPKDPFNAMLSFAYTLLSHDCACAAEAVGLDSYAGFLHRDRPGRESLALDLMEELRSIYADRVVLSLINNRVVDGKDFKMMENGAVLMSDDARKKFISKWQERKRSEITHPFLEEKIPWGLVPYTQALLMARFIRGDIEAYPPFMWK